MGDETTNPTMYCGHCKKDVPVENFVMHEVHCRRNIVLCPRCNEPVPQKELDEHVHDVHAAEACTKCGQQIEKRFLDQHMAEECPKRSKRCEFCDIEFAACDFVEHVNQCGSRTEPCTKCKRRVCLRDLPHHKCLPEANSTNQEKVCIYCGRAVDLSAYQQHVDGCGSTESQCESCQLLVLMQHMAAHLGSDCALHVVGASHVPSSIDILSSMFTASKPSINGVVLGAEPDSESSGDDIGAIGRQFPDSSFSPSFFREDVRQPSRSGTTRGGRGKPEATGLSNNSSSSRSSVLHQQTASNLTTGSRSSVGQSIARALPTDQTYRGTVHAPATDRSKEAAASPYGPIASTGLQQAVSAIPRPLVDPRRSESSAASSGARTTVQPGRNVLTRLSAASNRSSTVPEQSIKAVEVVKIPVPYHPAATPYGAGDEPRQHSGAASAPSKGNELSLPRRLHDAASAGPPDDDDDSMACQLCGEIFPLDVLRDHQEFCGVLDEHGIHVLDGVFQKGYTGNPQSVTLRNPYEFPVTNYENDLDVGSTNLPGNDYVSNVSAEVQLPCEFCERLFPSHELNIHQATCRGQLTHSSRPSLLGPPGLDQLSTQDDEEFCNYCLQSFPRSARHENSCVNRIYDY